MRWAELQARSGVSAAQSAVRLLRLREQSVVRSRALERAVLITIRFRLHHYIESQEAREGSR
jgi:hypothetical protein